MGVEEIELLEAKLHWRHAQDLVGRDAKTGGPIQGTSGEDQIDSRNFSSNQKLGWMQVGWADAHSAA